MTAPDAPVWDPAHDLLFQMITLGAEGVGKSALVEWLSDMRSTGPRHAIRVDFHQRIRNIDGNVVKLRLWDPNAVGFRERRIPPARYYRNACAILLVFDVSQRQTFDGFAHQLHDAQQHCNHPTTILLVGNKCDLVDEREVSTEEAVEYARDRGLAYMETSAKTGENVELALMDTARRVVAMVRSGELDEAAVKVTAPKQFVPAAMPKRSTCCVC
jgi:small GTP-binding protein